VTEGVVAQQERLGRLGLWLEPEEGLAILGAVDAALAAEEARTGPATGET
jgi:hypothetical protein